MKLLYSLILLVCFADFVCASSIRGLDGFQINVVDVAKNAGNHNNMGNIYFSEENYNAALLEYEIAYNLTKNTRASAPYAYNMARCMMVLKKYKQAQYLIEIAINNDCINMTYYKSLVDCYIALNTHKTELSRHISDTKNPYNRIIAGLIYLKTGEKLNAKILFDEFINEYPDMIISDDVRLILREMKKAS